MFYKKIFAASDIYWLACCIRTTFCLEISTDSWIKYLSRKQLTQQQDTIINWKFFQTFVLVLKKIWMEL